MKKTISHVARGSLATITMFTLVLGTFGASFGTFVPLAAAVSESCTPGTITLVSGTATTQSAGFTETTQTGPGTALLLGSYTPGTFTAAFVTPTTVIPPWVDPSLDASFTGSGAVWVSSASTWPGDEGNTEGLPANDSWRLFEDSFTLPVGAVVTDANIWYTADNAADVYLNGNTTPISTTNDVYGVTPAPNPPTNSYYGQVFTTAFSPSSGNNTLDFVVRNWSVDDTPPANNPVGLLYKAVINYTCAPPATVTIVKYIDSVPATAENANSAAFPMAQTYTIDDTPGNNPFTLSPVGVNTENPYEAITSPLDLGSTYTMNEVTGGEVVGTDCSANRPFSLVGYTFGDTLAEAQAAATSTETPSFTDLTSNKYIIVENHDCSTGTGGLGGIVTDQGVLHVDSIDSAEQNANGTADGTYEHGWSYTFHITAPMNEPNFAMKFADWLSGANILPVANNMRISSAQASNGPVTLTAANTYSSPALIMTGDLDGGTPGRQIDVVVEVKIPVGTVNGSYTTTYGVQTLP